MFIIACLKAKAIVAQADVTFVVRAIIWLEFGRLLVVVYTFFEVLHDEGHSSYQLVEHWTSIDVFRRCV